MDQARKTCRDLCPTAKDERDAPLLLPSYNLIKHRSWERPSRRNNPVAPTGGTWGINVKSLTNQAFQGRLSAALGGAAFLVGPMWLLALRKELFAHLGGYHGICSPLASLWPSLWKRLIRYLRELWVMRLS